MVYGTWAVGEARWLTRSDCRVESESDRTLALAPLVGVPALKLFAVVVLVPALVHQSSVTTHDVAQRPQTAKACKHARENRVRSLSARPSRPLN